MAECGRLQPSVTGAILYRKTQYVCEWGRFGRIWPDPSGPFYIVKHCIFASGADSDESGRIWPGSGRGKKLRPNWPNAGTAQKLPKVAKKGGKCPEMHPGALNLPALWKWGPVACAPAQGGIPKGENPGVENFDLAVDLLARMIFFEKKEHFFHFFKNQKNCSTLLPP